MLIFNWKSVSAILLSTLGLIVVVGAAGAALSGLDSDHLISQKGKRFGPQDIYLRTGEHITIVNDDGNFVHHAYIEDDELTFDSGDIEPGARAIITFPKEGDFTVLCGVHPKMRLAVRVRQTDRS